MAETSPDKIVISAIGPLITTVIGAAIGWLPGRFAGAIGSPLTVLLAAVGGISGLAFSLMYKRYIGVLGAGGGREGLFRARRLRGTSGEPVRGQSGVASLRRLVDQVPRCRGPLLRRCRHG